ncbi:MAG: hypothetical protein GQ475_05960 [Methylococcaceae bacterium]|nr:hypothetical protein [Methylococcaceae bacterium]
MKKLLLQLFTILTIVFNTLAPAGVTPGGEGEFEVDESSMLGFWGNVLTRDGPSGVNFKGKWKASVLVGEPLKVVGMKWQVGNSVRYDGSIYSTDGSLEQCNYIPQSVINNIEIIDLEIVGTIANPWTDEAFLFINADAMFNPDNNGSWGKTNLTLPASPDWKNLFYTSPHSTSLPWSSVSEKDAKNIMRDGIEMKDIAISKLSFNMTPVRLWLLKNECEEEEQVEEFPQSEFSDELEQLGSEDTRTSLIDDMTNLWDEFTTEETDFERELAGEENSVDGLDFESQLAGVDSYRVKLNRLKNDTNKAIEICNTNKPQKPVKLPCEKRVTGTKEVYHSGTCGRGGSGLCLPSFYSTQSVYEDDDIFKARCNKIDMEFESNDLSYKKAHHEWSECISDTNKNHEKSLNNL